MKEVHSIVLTEQNVLMKLQLAIIVKMQLHRRFMSKIVIFSFMRDLYERVCECA